MKVNDWFLNGCDYNTGVAIYTGLKKSKPNLLRLFKLKQTAYNTEKLKNELSKFKEVEVAKTIISEIATKPNQKPTPTQNQERKIKLDINTAPVAPQVYKPAKLNNYPVELHPTFIQQKANYHTACSLKIQLNNLPAEAEDEALQFCIQIEDLFDKIEAAWKVLDHYTETKTVLYIKPTNFTDLTPAQLLQRRNQKRSSLSKVKNKITQLTAALSKAETIQLKTKLNVSLARAKEKQINLQVDITKLTELVNSK